MNTEYWYLNEIGDAISSPQTASAESLREAATAYNDACRDANRRLREVDRLLRAGLRTEAIQLAEQEPNLLDHLGELDLAAIEDWQGMLAQWGLDLPPELEMGIAGELNVAYAEMLPLEQLMKQHRLLALARGPISARLKILRQISSKDELNPSWKEDIVAYEQVRLRQLRGEISQADDLGDLDGLNRINNEITDSHWITEVPSAVHSELKTAIRKNEREHAREKLQEIGHRLDRAYSEFDLPTATTLTHEWNTHSKIANLPADDPTAVAAAEAIDWVVREQQNLNDQEMFESSLRTLENALDRRDPREKLETLYHMAERFEQPIPELLQTRVAERIHSLESQQRRKGMLLIAVSIPIVVGVAALVGYFWHVTQQAALIAGHQEQLQSFVDSEKWQQAVDYGESLSAEIKADPNIGALLTTSAAELKSEIKRRNRIDQMLTQAESMDPEAPDPQLLGQLKKQVATTEEKQRLDQVELAVRQAAQSKQRQIDQDFLTSVKQWSERLNDLEDKESLENIDLDRTLSELSSDLLDRSDVTFTLRRQGEALEKRLRTIILRESNLAAERNEKNKLFSSVGNLSRYKAQLQKLTISQPDTIAATHAETVLADAEKWSSVASWASFWQQQPDWTALRSSQAGGVLATGDALLQRTTKTDLSQAYLDRKAFLNTIVKRQDIRVDSLESFLVKNKFMNEVWLVATKDGKRYFSAEKPKEALGGRFTTFEYFTGYTSAKRTQLSSSNIKVVAIAPQSKCSQKIAKHLAALPSSNWDKSFYMMATEVVESSRATEDPSLDPVLAMDMLRRILATGSEGSFLFGKAYESLVTKLGESSVDLSVSWFLPSDTDAENARKEAKAIVSNLPDLKPLYLEAQEANRHLCRPPASKITWVAALDRSTKGDWRFAPVLNANTNGELLVAERGVSDVVTLKPVANVTDGEVRWLRSVDQSMFLIGTPVFLQSTKQ